VRTASQPPTRAAALTAGIPVRSTQSKGGQTAATSDPTQASSTTETTTGSTTANPTADSTLPQSSQISVPAGPIQFSIGTLLATQSDASPAGSPQDQSDQAQTDAGTPGPVTAVSQQGKAFQLATFGPQAAALQSTVASQGVNGLNPVKTGPVKFSQMIFGTAGSFKGPGKISGDSEAAAAASQSSTVAVQSSAAQSSGVITASNATGPVSSSATDETAAPASSAKSDPSAAGSFNQPAPQPGSADRTPLNLDLSKLNLDLSDASLLTVNPPVENAPVGDAPVGDPVSGNAVASGPNTAAPSSPKQRLSNFNVANASQNSGDLFTLNPAIPASAGDPASSGAAQTAAGSAPASAQESSSQAGSSSNGGPDYSDFHVEALAAAGSGSSIPVAFEARLSPLQVSGASADPAPAQPSQAAEQLASKPSSAWSAAETNTEPTGAATSAAATVKPETLYDAGVAATPAAVHGGLLQSDAQPGVQAGTPYGASAGERMQSIIEAPAPLAGSRQSITVKVAGATSDTGIDLRFVERGGDIHLSVRTASPEVAQELRGGLNDLVGRLEHAGIRTEVSNTSSSNSASADSSKDQGEPDRKGSSRNPGDAQGQQQNSRGSNRSRWMEALEHSSTFSKEQNL
jgi:hypothetical protein